MNLEKYAFQMARGLKFSKSDASKISDYFMSTFSQYDFDEDLEGDPFFIQHAKKISDIRAKKIPNVAQNIQYIDLKYDFLGKRLGLFSFWKAFNIAALSCIEPIMDCAVVTSARNEGAFIVEWVAHNRAIGFKNVYIYTNNNTDESDPLLSELANNGFIKLIINETAYGLNPQIKSYEHALLMSTELRSYRWLMFLDCDEFVVLDQRHDFFVPNLIAKIESLPPSPIPACVCLNWLWFGSAGAVTREERNVTDRFHIAAPTSLFVKSIFRPQCVLSMQHVHKASLRQNEFMVNGGLKEISGDSHDTSFNFTEGRINHYWNKSFEEFLMKQARGIDREIWQRDTELFFEWDIEQTSNNFHPFQPELAIRLAQHQQEILGIQSIVAAESVTRRAYKELSKLRSSSGELQDFYWLCSSRYKILSKLKSFKGVPKSSLLEEFRDFIRTAIADRLRPDEGPSG